MFYYRGRKKKIAHLYPSPQCDVIIEPFCGSAAYSLHNENWKKDVRISDINPRTISVWKYLQAASKKDIDNLPNVNAGDNLNKFKLSDVERVLIGYHCSVGADQNTNIVSKFNRWSAGKRYISENLYKIKHWNISLKSYDEVENIEATWFIDPPYITNGNRYQFPFTDFENLALWCQSRNGQVIVCEEFGASWLPFEFLAESKIQRKRRVTEVLWHKQRLTPREPDKRDSSPSQAFSTPDFLSDLEGLS